MSMKQQFDNPRSIAHDDRKNKNNNEQTNTEIIYYSNLKIWREKNSFKQTNIIVIHISCMD